MRRVLQKTEIDCGVAVVAMLSSSTLKVAQSICGGHSDRGLRVSEMVAAVTLATEENWVASKAQYGMELARIKRYGQPVAVLIRQPGRPWGHWVVMVGRSILDPDKRIAATVYLSKYARRRWEIVRVVRRS